MLNMDLLCSLNICSAEFIVAQSNIFTPHDRPQLIRCTLHMEFCNMAFRVESHKSVIPKTADFCQKAVEKA